MNKDIGTTEGTEALRAAQRKTNTHKEDKRRCAKEKYTLILPCLPQCSLCPLWFEKRSSKRFVSTFKQTSSRRQLKKLGYWGSTAIRSLVYKVEMVTAYAGFAWLFRGLNTRPLGVLQTTWLRLFVLCPCIGCAVFAH